MGLTVIEKIIFAHSPKAQGDFVNAKVDLCFGNDITAPLAVKQFDKAGFTRVFNPRRIAFVCDHFVPARDLKAANNVKYLKEFAQRYKIPHFFDINKCGIEHVFLIERGLVHPGNLIVGADSHTCTFGGIGCASFGVGSTDLAAAMTEGKVWLRIPRTIKFVYHGKLPKWVTGKDLILHTISKIGVDGALYKVMEFAGPVIKKLDMEARLTMTNMAVEAGAKAGIIEPDEITLNYLRVVQGRHFTLPVAIHSLRNDKNASYEDVIEIEVSELEPQVACPHLPSNVKTVRKLSHIKLSQVVIGSCTNGRISDLRVAAKIFKGSKVFKGLRVIIIPATPAVYAQAEEEGLLRIFLESGCIISPPTCGPCLGGHMGILRKGEVALATTNRNFIARMGDPESYVYLSSPAVAAASAIRGKISHPEEVMKKRRG